VNLANEMSTDVFDWFETPCESLGPRIRETVLIDGNFFEINRPNNSDRMLGDPATSSALAISAYLPCWADLWPASRMLAKAVLREPWGLCSSALELGCGLGLPGIAALARGWHVTFSDRDLTALRFAGSNAKLNGYEEFKLLPLDWRRPPDGFAFPLVLASDPAYERGQVEALVATINKMLASEGMCLLTDQNRPAAAWLRQELMANDLVFTEEGMRAGEPGGRRFKGSLYRIRHRTTV